MLNDKMIMTLTWELEGIRQRGLKKTWRDCVKNDI